MRKLFNKKEKKKKTRKKWKKNRDSLTHNKNIKVTDSFFFQLITIKKIDRYITIHIFTDIIKQRFRSRVVTA